MGLRNMRFTDWIYKWADAQGIDDWIDDFKEWASKELGWDECGEMAVMRVRLQVAEVVYMLREFADTPKLLELDDAELGRWVAENNGFSWSESIDELIDDENEAFVKATAYISARYEVEAPQ